ncbi:MAG TPA: rhodanese-like domain-containing protein [Thermoanaerobaculia bacterium]|jgi:hypothetical protein
MHRALLAAVLLSSSPLFASGPVPANPAIDMEAHLRLSQEAARARETHRVTEDEFLRLSREPGTVILDARSVAKYDELHVKGAVNLSFPDITAASLAAIIPSASTRVLIYCNNNFTHADSAFPTKLPAASLNLSTYVTLSIYGYRNVWELGPLLDAKSCRLALESSAK